MKRIVQSWPQRPLSDSAESRVQNPELRHESTKELKGERAEEMKGER